MLLKKSICLSLAVASACLAGFQSLRADESPAETSTTQEVSPPAPAPADAPAPLPIVEDPGILIIPAAKLSPADAACMSPENSTQQVFGSDGAPLNMPAAADPEIYARIYRTIPFNRAEYNVNPSYRHDATMEILTGNARHQTIVKHTTERPRPIVQTAPPVLPWRYNDAVRGLNYYFYFPYWNFRGYY